MMQPRFDKRVGSAPYGLVEQPRFRAGFDFMRLRADIGEIDVVLADWWQEFSTGDDSLRQDLVDQAREEQARQRAQAPRPQPRAAAERPVQPRDAEPDAPAGEGDAPKKRRRRRRSGAKKSGDGAPDTGA